MNDLMTLDGIADALKLHRKFVRDRLVKKPGFPRPAVAISQKNRRWRASDIEAWVRSQTESMAR